MSQAAIAQNKLANRYFCSAVCALVVCCLLGAVEIGVQNLRWRRDQLTNALNTRQHAQQTTHSPTIKENSNPCGASGFGLLQFNLPFVCTAGDVLVIVDFDGSLPENYIDVSPRAVAVAVGDEAQPNFVLTLNKLPQLSNTLVFTSYINCLTGTIPTQIGKLTNLQRINFQDSELTGTLPTQLGNLIALTSLEIVWGSISGTIPSEIGKLINLSYLAFSGQELMGTVPFQLSHLTNLEQVYLDTNAKLGGLLYSELIQLPRLQYIKLSYCGFEGTLPQNYSIPPDLVFFAVSFNKLSGSIPEVLFSKPEMTVLRLNKNNFEGTLPSSIGQMSNMNNFLLQQNNFFGTLPSQLGLLTSIHEIVLFQNGFEGTLPSQLGELSIVRRLDISGNHLTGALPSQVIALIDSEYVVSNTSTKPREFSCINSGLSDTRCLALRNDFLGSRIFIGAIIVASLHLTVITVLIFFMWRYRTHAVLRTSGPLFSVLTLCGLGLLVCFVPLLGVVMFDVGSGVRTAACKGAAATLSFGLVIVMACIGVRNYPVLRIYNNPRMAKISLPPAVLLRGVAAAIVVNVCLLTPLLVKIRATHYDNTCVIGSNVALLAINIAFLCALSLFAVWISIRVRNAPCEYNETAQVGRATYNFVTFGFVMLVVSSVVKTNTARFLWLVACIFLCVESFIVFVYWFKFIVLFREVLFSASDSAANTQLQPQVRVYRSSGL